MKPVYSFYLEECDGRTVREELGNHIENMIQLLHLPGNVENYLSRIGLEREVFQHALKISIVFHDLGKAYYKNNIRIEKCKDNPGKQRKYLSYLGHEFLSTCLLYRTIQTPGTAELESQQWESDFEFIQGAILYAVLYHHHAMAYLERREELLLKKARLQAPSREETEYLASIIEKTISHEASEQLEKQITNKPPDQIVTKNCLNNVHREINLPWTRNPSVITSQTAFTLQRLLLTYLLVLDNLSATRTRNKRRQTPYLNSIKIFAENYLTPKPAKSK